ncbi:MarR family winged helix-turn-helix transcriptional regulator [Saccharopolyspora sp. K220]|uniref:MarR family winged helix-turn-helix transcriptional regulator n=1 Tax=Saccharopolyspora soli TaxID=2926618 RepID=UPI001F58BF07|nr:MarR family winged helix-turn-helix transcriptional regulator [Saccharopolyspora soli]MCI2416470.1 MarR family winged helix-turn-helix transcriptional regulator [Saccharopolyspora soli]
MELDQAVFHLMRRAMQEHTANWQARLPHLTKPQYAVLTAIRANPGIEQAQLGQRAAIDKATLASVLLRMEQRGLVQRSVDDADRRRRLLRLTDRGNAELRAVAPIADAVDVDLLDRLSPAERSELHRLLSKLVPADGSCARSS